MTTSYIYPLYDLVDLKPDEELTVYEAAAPRKYEAGIFPTGSANPATSAVKVRICDRTNRQLASIVLHETAPGEITYPEIDIEPDDELDESAVVSRLMHAAMLTARFQGYAYLVAERNLDEFTAVFGQTSKQFNFDAEVPVKERMLEHQENADLVLPLGRFSLDPPICVEAGGAGETKCPV